MRIAIIIVCFLIAGILASAQNLVPNSSFESYSSLPTGPGQYIRCNNWHNVNGWPSFQWPYASPDYLHYSGSGGAQLPNSVFGTCTPFAGNAVMSAVIWYTTPNFREYVACQLTSPMTVGQPYDITIHVRNSTSYILGIYGPQIALSVNQLSQSTHEPISYTPQLVPASIIYSTSWVTLTYNFTPTQPFQHMTIGNFYNDAATVRQSFGGGAQGAYYFYDGMSVTPTTVLDDGSLGLSGMSSEKSNLLEWTHDGETTDFSIWRSQDGEQFRMIGEAAAGTSKSYQDEAPYYGLNWYKIRKQNLDGSTTWSNVVRLENNVENELKFLTVYPNPASDEVTVQMEHPSVPEISVTMFDATGRLVHEASIATFGQRLSTFTLPVNDLSAGIYSLRLQAGSTFATRAIVVGK
jgi:hypothetical protein